MVTSGTTEYNKASDFKSLAVISVLNFVPIGYITSYILGLLPFKPREWPISCNAEEKSCFESRLCFFSSVFLKLIVEPSIISPLTSKDCAPIEGLSLGFLK